MMHIREQEIVGRTVHEYLGMTIDYYRCPGKVKFRMDDYVSSIPEEAPSDMKGVTVAANHPFTTHKVFDPGRRTNHVHMLVGQ